MFDSQLRGIGIPGAALSAIKNTILEAHKQEKKGWDTDHTYTMLQMVGFSPPASSKLRKIYSGFQTFKFDKKIIPEMGWDIDNPAFMGVAKMVEGITNVPFARVLQKRQNIKEALDGQNQWWQREFSGLGWAPWDLGTEIEEELEAEQRVKDRKKQKKKSTSEETDRERKIEKYRKLGIDVN